MYRRRSPLLRADLGEWAQERTGDPDGSGHLLDKFALGIKAFIEDQMLRRLGENARSLISYTDDQAFQNVALTVFGEGNF